MGRSPGFGSIESDFISRYSHLVSLRLRTFWYLTLPLPITRRTVLQKVRGCTRMVLPLLVNIEFQVLFHSPPGVLFTFPSQYCCAIGHRGVFRLGGWSPRLPTRFLVSRGTLDPTVLQSDFVYRAFTFYGAIFQKLQLSSILLNVVLNPRLQVIWFGLFPFRSPLLRKSMFLSPPEGT